MFATSPAPAADSPFADPAMLRLCGQFERGVYALAEAR
jgi:hypothetical protein